MFVFCVVSDDVRVIEETGEVEELAELDHVANVFVVFVALAEEDLGTVAVVVPLEEKELLLVFVNGTLSVEVGVGERDIDSLTVGVEVFEIGSAVT